MKLHDVLGVEVDSTPEEIKKAYHRLALLYHPDRTGGKSDDLFKKINTAYETLMNPELLAKYEATATDAELSGDFPMILYPGKRLSENHRAKFKAFKDLLENVPEILIKRKDGEQQAAFLDANKIAEELPSYYKGLYNSGTESFQSIYAYIAHKSETTQEEANWKFIAFTVSSALALFRKFLAGELYGGTLRLATQNLQAHCIALRRSKSSMHGFFNALYEIIHVTEDSAQRVHYSLQKIFEFFHQYPEVEKTAVQELYEDLYFRHFVMFAIRKYWLDSAPLIDPGRLSELSSLFSSRLKPNLLFKALTRLEEGLKHAVKPTQSDTSKIYEEAYKQIDLSICPVLYSSRVNAILYAAMVFQLGSKREQSAGNIAASERMAMELYQLAIEIARKGTPVLLQHACVLAVKALSEFQYDHIELKSIKAYREKNLRAQINPGDIDLDSCSGSLQETIQGAIKRVAYLTDLVPVLPRPLIYTDMMLFEHTERSRLTIALARVAGPQVSVSIEEKATKLYHLYEGLLKNWIKGYDEDTLRFRAIQALLKAAGSSTRRMNEYLGELNIMMERDHAGFFLPHNKLNIPEDPNNPVFKAVHGFTLNLHTGKLDLLLEPCDAQSAPHERVLTMYDIQQMIEHGITYAVFSLDHPDPNKPLDPRQKMRIDPANVAHTEFLKTMLTIDDLLKFFTTGVEISSEPPYRRRSVDELVGHLPPYLRAIIKLGQSLDGDGSVSRRFWFKVNGIETAEEEKGAVFTLRFGATKIGIDTHMLRLDASGEMVDTVDDEDKSDAVRFAKEFTEHYAEFAYYFPELRRFAVMMQVAAVVAQFESIKELVQKKITHLKVVLDNIIVALAGTQNVIRAKITAGVRGNLQKIVNKRPKHFKITDKKVIDIYQGLFEQSVQASLSKTINNFVGQLSAAEKVRAEQQIRTALQGQMPIQDICNQINEPYQKVRSTLIGQVGATPECKQAVNAILDGNLEPLLAILVRKNLTEYKGDIEKELSQEEAVLQAFNEIGLGKLKQDTLDEPPSYVPAAYNPYSERGYVYGGVLALPKILTKDMEVSELCRNMSSSFSCSLDGGISQKAVAIDKAKSYLFYNGNRSSLRPKPDKLTRAQTEKLEHEIFRAEMDLASMEHWRRFDDLMNNRFHIGPTIISLNPHDIVSAHKSGQDVSGGFVCTSNAPEAGSSALGVDANFCPPIYRNQVPQQPSANQCVPSSNPSENMPTPPQPSRVVVPERIHETPYTASRAQNMLKKKEAISTQKIAYDLSNLLLSHAPEDQVEETLKSMMQDSSLATHCVGFSECSKSWGWAAALGSWDSLVGFANFFIHPDEWYLPLQRAVFDGLIITARYSQGAPFPTPDSMGALAGFYADPAQREALDEFSAMIAASGHEQELFDEAMNNMAQRAKALKELDSRLEHASEEERIRFAFGIGGTMLLPGGAFKAAASVVSKVKSAGNLRKFGVPFKPEAIAVPANTARRSVVMRVANDPESVTLIMLRKTEKLPYIVTEEGQLLVTRRLNYSLGEMQPSHVFATDLAAGKRIVAIGEVTVHNPRITSTLDPGQMAKNLDILEITTFSEEIAMQGEHMSTAVATAFKNAGFTGVEGKVKTHTYLTAGKKSVVLGASVVAAESSEADIPPSTISPAPAGGGSGGNDGDGAKAMLLAIAGFQEAFSSAKTPEDKSVLMGNMVRFQNSAKTFGVTIDPVSQKSLDFMSDVLSGVYPLGAILSPPKPDTSLLPGILMPRLFEPKSSQPHLPQITTGAYHDKAGHSFVSSPDGIQWLTQSALLPESAEPNKVTARPAFNEPRQSIEVISCVVDNEGQLILAEEDVSVSDLVVQAERAIELKISVQKDNSEVALPNAQRHRVVVDVAIISGVLEEVMRKQLSAALLKAGIRDVKTVLLNYQIEQSYMLKFRSDPYQRKLFAHCADKTQRKTMEIFYRAILCAKTPTFRQQIYWTYLAIQNTFHAHIPCIMSAVADWQRLSYLDNPFCVAAYFYNKMVSAPHLNARKDVAYATKCYYVAANHSGVFMPQELRGVFAQMVRYGKSKQQPSLADSGCSQ